MKDFRSFPVFHGQKRENTLADKSVDETLQTIVVNARKFKKQMETAEPQRQALFSITNNNNKKMKTTSDVRNPLQLQYFNLAPSFVTRKRKHDDRCLVQAESDSLVQSASLNETCQSNESQCHLNSTKDVPNKYQTQNDVFDSDGLVKQQKADIVSPLPVFIVETSKTSSPLANSTTSTESTGIELIRNVKGAQHQKRNEDQEQVESCGNREEEPVKNSMFWLYRSFPHII